MDWKWKSLFQIEVTEEKELRSFILLCWFRELYLVQSDTEFNGPRETQQDMQLEIQAGT